MGDGIPIEHIFSTTLLSHIFCFKLIHCLSSMELIVYNFLCLTMLHCSPSYGFVVFSCDNNCNGFVCRSSGWAAVLYRSPRCCSHKYRSGKFVDMLESLTMFLCQCASYCGFSIRISCNNKWLSQCSRGRSCGGK